MKKKKILFITPLPPPFHGSSMVSQSMKESTRINNAFDCDFVNLSTSRRMDEIGRRPLMKIWRFFCIYCQVVGHLVRHRYDLCYLAITCHGIGFMKDAPFVLLCKLFGRKVVIHQHNKGMARYVDKPLYRWLLPMTYRNTNVMLLSPALYEDISRVVKEEQIIICANGIPPLSDNMEHKNRERTHILFLSNLLVNKGVFVLLDACKILKERRKDFDCHFVGCETDEIDGGRFEEETKQRGIEDCVRYEGKKYGHDKVAEFEWADVFVQPTFDDCFPLTILEAMSCGLPVIATAQGAIAEMLGESHKEMVCKTNDATDLANKIERLIDHPEERTRCGEAVRQRFQTMYTLNIFEERMATCLAKCMKR